MKKNVRLLAILTLLLCMNTPVFSSPLLITDNNLQKDESTRQAIELTKKLITSDKNSKDNILNNLKTLLSENPENNTIKNIYTNNLIAERHYKEGLENLEILNKTNLTRANLLNQCMLKERLGSRDENCYKQVIILSEKSGAVDSDYISALFFAEDERFKNLKSTLIKDNKFTESDFLVFTLGREKMLHEFYP